MKRRQFLALATCAVAFPHVVKAQPKTPRVAVLSIGLDSQTLDAFHQGLAEWGFVDKKTIVIESFTAPSNEALPLFAAKAVSSRPDVIFTYGITASEAARDATDNIPIVFANVPDALGSGLIKSLAQPGNNLTGTTSLFSDLVGKQLSIFKTILPSLSHLAVIVIPTRTDLALVLSQTRIAAEALSIDPVFVNFNQEPDLPRQLKQIISSRPQAIFIPGSTFFSQQANREALYDFEFNERVPLLWTTATYLPFIGMLAYGANGLAATRRSAGYVSAILRGTRPQVLPVELPAVFDLAINLTTAKSIGITIPPEILAQATLVSDEEWHPR